jgi:uncharacterized protein
MNILTFSATTFLGSVAAGFLGALTGLGGGVVIVPLLVLLLGVDIHYAAGASLVSVIATSSGSAAAYVKEGYTNIRVGMFLESATTIGAITGAFLTSRLNPTVISTIFGSVLLYSAFLSFRGRHGHVDEGARPDPLAARLRLDGSFPSPTGSRDYRVHRVPLGFGLMLVAGVLSGLLGIGSGAFKVLAMDRAMRLPFKVATTTSNFMIGVTAAASAGVYLNRGYLDPGLAMPVMLGVLLGSVLGVKQLFKRETALLKVLFSAVILVLGIEMIYNGLTGGL